MRNSREILLEIQQHEPISIGFLPGYNDSDSASEKARLTFRHPLRPLRIELLNVLEKLGCKAQHSGLYHTIYINFPETIDNIGTLRAYVYKLLLPFLATSELATNGLRFDNSCYNTRFMQQSQPDPRDRKQVPFMSWHDQTACTAKKLRFLITTDEDKYFQIFNARGCSNFYIHGKYEAPNSYRALVTLLIQHLELWAEAQKVPFHAYFYNPPFGTQDRKDLLMEAILSIKIPLTMNKNTFANKMRELLSNIGISEYPKKDGTEKKTTLSDKLKLPAEYVVAKNFQDFFYLDSTYIKCDDAAGWVLPNDIEVWPRNNNARHTDIEQNPIYKARRGEGSARYQSTFWQKSATEKRERLSDTDSSDDDNSDDELTRKCACIEIARR